MTNPPYKIGDVLYVRETMYNDLPEEQDLENVYYRADGTCCEQIPECQCFDVGKPKWTPSIRMPKWASRIHLEVMKVRVEKACDITTRDAIAEGMKIPVDAADNPKNEFWQLWTRLYEDDAWNKFVWVFELKRVK